MIRQVLQEAEALARSGKLGQAQNTLTDAVSRAPNAPALLGALGRIALARGKLSTAQRHLERAAALAPNAPGILHSLGTVLLRRGALADAARVLGALTRRFPKRTAAWVTLGEVQLRQRNLHEAEATVDVLLRQAPDAVHGLRLRARVAIEHGRLEAADAALRAWLVRDPTSREASGLLADLLSRARRFDEASAIFEAARSQWPDDLELATRHAAHLGHSGAFDEARALFVEIANRAPTVGAHLANRGIAEMWTGDLPAAIASLEAAVTLEPAYPSHHWNLGHALLQSGDYARGFEAHEQRGSLFGKPPWWADRWRGETLPAGTPLVLDAVQGLGDAIQFVRFAQDAAARGARVVVRAHPRLHGLFAATKGVAHTLSSDDPPPPGSRRAELLSMPRILGVRTAQDLGHRTPYVQADPLRVRRWKARVGSTRRNIGIVWQGNPKFVTDHLRSPPLAHYLPLTQLPGVRVFSLQKFHGLDQLAAVQPATFPITDLGAELDLDVAFLDTAAAMVALDLVLTSDTSTAHLAGALGVPTWVVLPYAPDWRWPRTGTSTPWYPSMRLFRQPAPHAWEPVFTEVAAALQAELGHAAG